MSMTMSMHMSGAASSTAAAAASASATAMDMDMGHGGGGSCKISMLWNWYTIDACFLAESWHVKNSGMFAVSCIGVAFLVVSMEFLRRLSKEYDAAILRQFQRNVSMTRTADLKPNGSNNNNESCCVETPVPAFVTFRATPLQQFIRSLIHAATFGVAYIVMLLAMYFNGFIIISIIIGSFIGKFLCDWMIHKVPIGRMAGAGEGSSAVEEPTVCCG